jgi:uncharacterized membrane protein YedE/YeeE
VFGLLSGAFIQYDATIPLEVSRMWLKNVGLFIFQNNWPWWLTGLLIGLTVLALVWVTGRLFGVSSAYSDVCDLPTCRFMTWRIWFIIGLPLGAFLAHLYSWNWTLLYGRLDALCMGSSFLKILVLFLGGFLLGFGARWSGGCTGGHTIMGIAQRSLMSLVSTLV